MERENFNEKNSLVGQDRNIGTSRIRSAEPYSTSDHAHTVNLTYVRTYISTGRRFVILVSKIMVFRSTGPENHSLCALMGFLQVEFLVKEID